MNVWTRLTGLSLLALLLALPAAAAEEAEDLHVTVHLRTGAKIEGMVRSGLELLVDRSFRSVPDASNPGAGYRIWYSTGTNGFIFVLSRDIVRMENRGPVTNAQRQALEKALAQLREHGRQRAREELKALEERQKAAVEEARVSEKVKEEEIAKKKVEEAAERRNAILEKFPPSDWTPERRATIQRNRAVLGLPPSAEEQEWLDSFDAWKSAYDAWLESEKKQAEPKNEDEPKTEDEPKNEGTEKDGPEPE